jgi:hypothetical protein
LFTGYRGLVRDDKKVLELGGGDGCTKMLMYLMPLKVVQVANFILSIFTTMSLKGRKMYCTFH